MGYRVKLAERERARELRAQAWTIGEIVDDLGVSRSSVSVWVRDVRFDEATRAACTSTKALTWTAHVRSGRPGPAFR